MGRLENEIPEWHVRLHTLHKLVPRDSDCDRCGTWCGASQNLVDHHLKLLVVGREIEEPLAFRRRGIAGRCGLRRARVFGCELCVSDIANLRAFDPSLVAYE